MSLADAQVELPVDPNYHLTLARQIAAGVVAAGTKLALGTPVVEAIGAEPKSRFTGRIPKLTLEVK